MNKYRGVESIVDEFVSILLRELMFNEEWLFVFPQLPLKLIFGEDIIKESIADKIIIDIISFYRMSVFEDKSVKSVDNKENNSEPQLIAESIAVHQQNMKRKSKDINTQQSKKPKLNNNNEEEKEENDTTNEPLISVRVNGYEFYFYSVSISSHILQAMKLQKEAVSDTNVLKYSIEEKKGFNFLKKNDRKIIIESLDKICYVLRKIGILSDRRESGSRL